MGKRIVVTVISTVGFSNRRKNLYVVFVPPMFKGTVSRDFLLLVFHESVSPKPLSIQLGPFRIFPKIRGFATGINDTGGKLPPPVSTTPAANLPPVSATPVANNEINIRLRIP
jgi:hypothetical protein